MIVRIIFIEKKCLEAQDYEHTHGGKKGVCVCVFCCIIVKTTLMLRTQCQTRAVGAIWSDTCSRQRLHSERSGPRRQRRHRSARHRRTALARPDRREHDVRTSRRINWFGFRSIGSIQSWIGNNFRFFKKNFVFFL